jgi:hypothetical protein
MITRTWTKDSISFENLKIYSPQATILLCKLYLKSSNCAFKNGLKFGQQVSNLTVIDTV